MREYKMKKPLYRKPIRKSKELLFYICTIGRENISIIITTEESIYWRVRDKIQEMVDLGCFDNHFSRGQVFVQRIDRIAKDKLTEQIKLDKIRKIKNNFRAITYQELASANRELISNLEQFMTDEPNDNYYCEIEKLEKILPLQEVSKEQYFYHALNERFPEFANKLIKEHKHLADTIEVE